MATDARELRTTPGRRALRRPGWPSIAAACGCAFASLGLVIGSRSLGDNSSFTHLATGRLLLESGLPTTDPYSYSAPGAPWVVQSWLVSWVYGLVDSWAGGTGLRLLGGLLGAALAWTCWRLTRPAQSLVPRVVLAGFAVVVGSTFWQPRPLLVGLLLLALVLVVVVEGRDPRWLVPLFWVWGNSHGSFPLGLVAIAALALGRRLDGEDAKADWRALGWAVVGTAAAAVGPLGPKVLLFPVELLGRMEILQQVVEWKSPSFTEGWARVFLLQVVVAVVVLVRRPSYRAAVPLVLFTAGALMGLRNVPVASIVLLPGTAACLAGVGRLRGGERGPVGAIVGAGLLVAGLVVGSAGLRQAPYDLRGYPVDALVWLEQHVEGIPERPRVASQDTTGNLLELLHGPDARVFLDDRYDMYPVAVLRDYLVLHGGQPGWAGVLDAYDVDYVVWGSGEPLSQLLVESPGWRVVYRDATAVVACRRGAARCNG